MAQINMCDRCGNMGLSTALGTCVFHPTPTGPTTKQEWCPECVAEFLAWLTENVPVRNGVPFREEYREPVKELESGKDVE
ncbi:hypothetical protein SEA_FORTHEBOIS_2 [Streptomyces phage Forthebois]|uniref:Uncharacterized protein n=1 Tax=Streptomyces phage Forthebois TaxID=2562185 RepID=A0A4D6E4F2_9VIRU|nr:hypothetical protein KMD60_gp02 [Streptomyces phage Forthebois]QBZ72835.1 hypothetical protein SEA_FORTHEBOIS_2 [Streptomyces phage Forthebois]